MEAPHTPGSCVPEQPEIRRDFSTRQQKNPTAASLLNGDQPTTQQEILSCTSVGANIGALFVISLAYFDRTVTHTTGDRSGAGPTV